MSLSRLLYILLPALALSVTAAQSLEITVKAGDTLWSLAERYNTTVDAILNTNGLTGQDLIPGAILKIPDDAQPTQYTVKAGDTLYDVATAFDLSVDDLIALNGLNGSGLSVGRVLLLKASGDVAPPQPLTITVKPGDTLWAIAAEYEVNLATLSSANGLSKSKVLQPGDTLLIPGRYADASTADQGGAAAPAVTVAAGESLSVIAARHNTTVSALMAANNLRSTKLFVGQKLHVVAAADLLPATTGTPGLGADIVMVWPLVGAVTSKFGYRQLRGSPNHTGVDIDGNTGDPVMAATAGTVTFSGWRSGYGNLVIIQTGNEEYYYGHASELWVGAGETVEMGEIIALVGSTGFSTGSHLHFEIRVDGTPVDPLPVLEQQAVKP